MRIEKLIQPKGHPSAVDFLFFTPDGEKLISCCNNFMKCWNVRTGNLLWTLPHRLWLFDTDITSDGKLLLRGDEILDFVDIEKGQIIASLRDDFDYVGNVKVSPDGKSLVILTGKEIKDKEFEFLYYLQLWSLVTKKVLWKRKIKDIGNVIFIPNTEKLIYAKDKTVKILEAKSGKELQIFNVFEKSKCHFSSLHVSPDGKLIATTMVFYRTKNGKSIKRENKIVFINLTTGKVVKTFDDYASVTFNPNRKIAALGGSREISLIDTATFREIRSLKSRLCQGNWRQVRKTVFSLAFSPDGKFLASGGLGIELWDLENDSIVWKVEAADTINFAFPFDNSLVLVTDTHVSLLTNVNNIQRVIKSNGYIKSAAFNSATGLLACGTEDKKVLIVDVSNQKTVKEIPCPTSVYSLTFSKDGKNLAAGCFGSLLLINLNTWKVSKISLANFAPSSLIYKDNCILGCYYYKNSELILEDLTNREIIGNYGGHASAFSFSSDGKYLAIGKQNGEVTIINTESEEPINQFKVKDVSTLKFVNSNFLACGTLEGEIKLLNLKNDKFILNFRCHNGLVRFINYSKDKNFLVSSGIDGALVKINF
jgi:WD40 repeat protein